MQSDFKLGVRKVFRQPSIIKFSKRNITYAVFSFAFIFLPTFMDISRFDDIKEYIKWFERDYQDVMLGFSSTAFFLTVFLFFGLPAEATFIILKFILAVLFFLVCRAYRPSYTSILFLCNFFVLDFFNNQLRNALAFLIFLISLRMAGSIGFIGAAVSIAFHISMFPLIAVRYGVWLFKTKPTVLSYALCMIGVLGSLVLISALHPNLLLIVKGSYLEVLQTHFFEAIYFVCIFSYLLVYWVRLSTNLDYLILITLLCFTILGVFIFGSHHRVFAMSLVFFMISRQSLGLHSRCLLVLFLIFPIYNVVAVMLSAFR